MTVVFLHGLGRTHRSFGRLRRRVERAGFATWARTYPSRRENIVDLANRVGDWLQQDLPHGPTFAVTHSLGGIVLRHLAGRFAWQGAVMLAPPNGGSQLATRLGSAAWFRAYFGPAGQQVASGIGVDGSPWPEPPSPFMVIAGSSGLSMSNPTSWLTRGFGWFPSGAASDGTVLVEETRLRGAESHHVVAAGHAQIMNNSRAMNLTVSFLLRLRDGATGR